MDLYFHKIIQIIFHIQLFHYIIKIALDLNITNHGYVQLLSRCSCKPMDSTKNSNDDSSNSSITFQPCNNLDSLCATGTTTTTTTTTTNTKTNNEQEHRLLNSSLSANKTSMETISRSNDDREVNDNIGKIWCYVYGSSSVTNGKNESSDCDVKNIGDFGLIHLLSNTNGQCKLMSSLINKNYQYYSLTLSNFNTTTTTEKNKEKIDHVALLCNSGCTVCGFDSNTFTKVNVEFGDCYSLTTTLNTLFLQCHVETSNESIDDVCLGGNRHNDKQHTHTANDIVNETDSDIIWINFNDSTNCNSDLILMQNIGPIIDTCLPYSNENPDGTYSVLTKLYNLLPTTPPSQAPTGSPTTHPTRAPTNSPTTHPTRAPTLSPTKTPTFSPTASPTKSPTFSPTKSPTKSPTHTPVTGPTPHPTRAPTRSPTESPTDAPTKSPSRAPTRSPTKSPTKDPTNSPTESPTRAPTTPTTEPTRAPTESPTDSPTHAPTHSPSKAPTDSPTGSPTRAPTVPTFAPTPYPLAPTLTPSINGSFYYDLSLSCNSSICGQCEQEYDFLIYGICKQAEIDTIVNDTSNSIRSWIYSHKFLFDYDLQLCGNPYENHKKSKKNNRQVEERKIIEIGMATVIPLLLIGLAIWVAKKYYAISLKELFCQLIHINCCDLVVFCCLFIVGKCREFGRWLVSCVGCGLANTSKVEKIHNGLWILVIGSTIGQSIVWYYRDPWRVFNQESFERLGIPADTLDIDQLTDFLDAWSYYSPIFFLVSCCIFGLLLVGRICLIKPHSELDWMKWRIFLLFLFLSLEFLGVFLLPSLIYPFNSSIKLNPDENDNSFIDNDETRSSINSMIGYSFVGIFLSYLANIILYFLHCIPVAAYFGCLIYVVLLMTENYDKCSNNEAGGKIEKNQNVSNNYLDGISNHIRANLLSRMIVIMFLLETLTSFMEALPVIVLYQSFGVNAIWIIIWTFWWTIPVLLLIHAWYTVDQYIQRLRFNSPLDDPLHRYSSRRKDVDIDADNGNDFDDDDEAACAMNSNNIILRTLQLWSIKRCKCHIYLNLTCYSGLFMLTMIYGMYYEHKETSMQMSFIVVSSINTFTVCLCFIFYLLHVMCVQYCQSNDNTASQWMQARQEQACEQKDEDEEVIQPLLSSHNELNDNDNCTDSDMLVGSQAKKIENKMTYEHFPPPNDINNNGNNDNKENNNDSMVNNRSFAGGSVKSLNDNKNNCNLESLQGKAMNENMSIATSRATITNSNIAGGDDDKYIGVDYVHSAKCGFVVWVFIYWLFEIEERQKPLIFGERILLRRLFLTCGTIFYSYIILKTFFEDILGESVKHQVINLLNSLDIGVTWPDDENGGTLFDSTFEAYGEARYISYVFYIIAIMTFIISLLFDLMKRSRVGLQFSRVLAWISVIFLFMAIFSTGMPNYLKSTPIDDICPYCAPEFNNAVYLVSGDIIGIFCSVLFTVEMLPILIAITPSLVRAAYLVLHDNKIYRLSKCEQDTLCVVFKLSTLLTPLLTFLPLLVYQQLMGDNVVAILLVIFWIVPIIIGMKMVRENVFWYYLGYLWVYLGALLAILVYHWIEYGLPKYVERMFLNVETYMEVTAEIFLANVILGDFLYAILMGFR